MTQTATESSLTTPPVKKAKIHVFFCIPKNGGGHHVLGNKETASALCSVGGLLECVSFQKGQNPEAMKADILSADAGTQSDIWSRVDLHFFCNSIYKDAVVACLDGSRDKFVRGLVLHTGNDTVGWATFIAEGYACGSVGQS